MTLATMLEWVKRVTGSSTILGMGMKRSCNEEAVRIDRCDPFYGFVRYRFSGRYKRC